MELLIVLLLLATAVLLIVLSYLLFKLRVSKQTGHLRKWLVRCFCCHHRITPPQAAPLQWQYHQLPGSENGCFEHCLSDESRKRPEEATQCDDVDDKYSAKQQTLSSSRSTGNCGTTTAHLPCESNVLRLNSRISGGYKRSCSYTAVHLQPSSQSLSQAVSQADVVCKLARVHTWPRYRPAESMVRKVMNCATVSDAASRAGAPNVSSTQTHVNDVECKRQDETVARNCAVRSNSTKNDVTIQINEGCDSNEEPDDGAFELCDVWQLRAQFENEEDNSDEENNEDEDSEAAAQRLEERESRRQHYVHVFYTKHNADSRHCEHSAADDSSVLSARGAHGQDNAAASSAENASALSSDSLNVSCELSTSFSIPVSFESADLPGLTGSPSPREFVKEVTNQLLVSVRSDQNKSANSNSNANANANANRSSASKQSSVTSENDTVGSTIRFSKTGLARRRQFSAKRRHMLPVYETVDYGNGVPQVDNNHHAPFMSLRESSIAQPDEIAAESVSPSVRDMSQQLTCSSSGSVFNQNYSPSMMLPCRNDDDQLVCVDSKTQAIVSEFLRGEACGYDDLQRYRIREKRLGGTHAKHNRTQSETMNERQTLLQPCRRYHAKILLGGVSSRRSGRLQQMYRLQYHRSADSATGATAAEDCNETVATSSGNQNARMFIRHQVHSFESNQTDVGDVLTPAPAVPCYSVPAICGAATATGSISASGFSDNSNYFSEAGQGEMLSESMNSSRSTSFRDIPVIRLTTDTEDTAQL